MVTVSETDMVPTSHERAVRRCLASRFKRWAGVGRVLSRGKLGFQQDLEAGWARLGAECIAEGGEEAGKGQRPGSASQGEEEAILPRG